MKHIENVLIKVHKKFKDNGLDLDITINRTNLNESDESNYSMEWSQSFLEWKIEKSIKKDVIDNLGGGDIKILIVDKRKAIESATLRGQANGNCIELYSSPAGYVKESKINGVTRYADQSNSRGADYRHDEYVLIHEILHVLEKTYLNSNELHRMIEVGLFEQYFQTIVGKTIEILVDKNDLLPLVKKKANDLIYVMKKLNRPIRITEGFRSIERQNELYAQGRTTPGNIVTNAKGGESFHNYGIAFDIVFIETGYNPPAVDWDIVGFLGKRLGFEWGGDWKSFVDKPHFEMPLKYSLKDFQNGKIREEDYNLN
jgi:hypothetical protein